jgi:hypothetical protein
VGASLAGWSIDSRVAFAKLVFLYLDSIWTLMRSEGRPHEQ